MNETFEGNDKTRFGTATHDLLKFMRSNPPKTSLEYIAFYVQALKSEGIPFTGDWAKKAQFILANVSRTKEFFPIGRIVDMECSLTPDSMLDKMMLEKYNKRFLNVQIMGNYRLRGQPDLVSEVIMNDRKIRVVDDYKTGSTILTDTSFVQIYCYALLDNLAFKPDCSGYYLRYLPVEHKAKKIIRKLVKLQDIFRFTEQKLIPAYKDWEAGNDMKVPSTECRFCSIHSCEYNYSGKKKSAPRIDF